MNDTVEDTQAVLMSLSLCDGGVVMEEVDLTFPNKRAGYDWLRSQSGHPFLYYILNKFTPIPDLAPIPQPEPEAAAAPSFEAVVDVQGRIKFTNEDGNVRYSACPDWLPVGTKIGVIS